MKIRISVVCILLCGAVVALAADPYLARRQAMVEHDIKGRGIRDRKVLEAMSRVPRHLFVGERQQGQAYGDHPLPIGEGFPDLDGVDRLDEFGQHRSLVA